MKSLEACINGLKEVPSAFRERKFELIVQALEAINDRLTLLELNKADRPDAING